MQGFLVSVISIVFITDLVKTILSQLNKSYTGTSLARIAVEVGEEEDIRLLVQSGTVDWTETGENEDPAILWALKNDKLAIVQLLINAPDINLNIRDREGWSLVFRAISTRNRGEFIFNFLYLFNTHNYISLLQTL